jgi:plasmid stability protein
MVLWLKASMLSAMERKQPGDKYIVRFPEGMRDRLAEEARRNGRSMNAEVVARIQATLDAGDAVSAPQMLARFDRLALQVDALHKWMKTQPTEGGIERLPDDHPDQVRLLQPGEAQKFAKGRLPAKKARRKSG